MTTRNEAKRTVRPNASGTASHPEEPQGKGLATTETTVGESALANTSAPVKRKSREELVALITARINAKNPSAEDLQIMREAMAAIPDLAHIVGNISFQVRHEIIERLSSNVIIRESIDDEVQRLEDKLGYKESPAIEQILIRQISVCWLVLYQAQEVYTRVMAGSLSLDQATWHEKRLTMVQGRFLRAVETLAKVRRLSNRSIQLLAANVLICVIRGLIWTRH